MDICTAIIEICQDKKVDPPSVSVTAEDYGQITWHDSNPHNISVDEIKVKQAELKKLYDSQAYARSRKEFYDKLNQFELIYDDKQNGTDNWTKEINAIKAKFPK
jgi:hypothetical protein